MGKNGQDYRSIVLPIEKEGVALAMKRKAIALTIIVAFLCSLAFLTINVESAKAITIGSNGSISGTDKLRCDGNVYTLTGNIVYTIRVDKSNVVLDGAGFTLEGNPIEGNGAGLIILPGVDEVTIKNFKIKGFGSGITLKGSGNTVTGCTITDCFTGIWLNEATGNTISGNVLLNDNAGIQIRYSSNNVFRNNRFENSSISTGTDDNFNDIDPSNTIDGKPIYYLVNQKGLVINPTDYPEIGYLALVNCTCMTVKDLRISGSPANGNGIILRYTTNSTIIHNSLTNLWSGIYSYNSYNNTITENYISNNTQSGIAISATIANTITRNNIENNKVGISLMGSAQIIYHNNFVNNTLQVDSANWHPLNRLPMPYGMHVWDNGYPSGGNFWSDYNTTDSNNDGIADTAYVINQYRNNTDHYPLAKPINDIPEFPKEENSSGVDTPQFPTAALAIATLSALAVAIGLIIVFFKKNTVIKQSCK